ncbi:TetR/AcrR family transcriptional regulator [Saccharibacillus qingshengii]|jgi:AcrR family transcriptional regulator|uniref:TetR/AcrR family transcriptional regulator n=1 Tax=Saccharibacillus qingshengii TaxID=1763540 RepID=UPI001555A193|nr:TetR/AcrR family transcriptional regulator [Saccharibacillus qingshengii]
MTETWHQHRKQQNREDLIAAGRTLFLQRAFPGVSVKDVCELAGVSRVTYYKHFESIDELAFEVQMEALEHMTASVQTASQSAALSEPDPASGGEFTYPTDGAAMLHRMLEAWSVYAARNRNYMKFILLFDLHYDAYPPEKALSSRYRAFILEKKRQHFLNDALGAGIRDGSLRSDLDLNETGEFVFTAMMGLLQKLCLSYAAEGEEGDAEAAEEAALADSRRQAISRRFIAMILDSLRRTDRSG